MKPSEIIDNFGGLREMSDKTGVPYKTLQNWKSGRRKPEGDKAHVFEFHRIKGTLPELLKFLKETTEK
ncbi:MAG: hypothetical protein GY757_10590 [bacterium]|nr:hypothetical protein [bacterium]